MCFWTEGGNLKHILITKEQTDSRTNRLYRRSGKKKLCDPFSCNHDTQHKYIYFNFSQNLICPVDCSKT